MRGEKQKKKEEAVERGRRRKRHQLGREQPGKDGGRAFCVSSSTSPDRKEKKRRALRKVLPDELSVEEEEASPSLLSIPSGLLVSFPTPPTPRQRGRAEWVGVREGGEIIWRQQKKRNSRREEKYSLSLHFSLAIRLNLERAASELSQHSSSVSAVFD